MTLRATASQTVGPFFSLGLSSLYRAELGEPGAQHTRYAFTGRVLDGDGAPISDAVLELWQADADGRYAHREDLTSEVIGRTAPALRGGTSRDLQGFGRVPTDPQGRFAFSTTMPGAVPAGDAMQAPHINVQLFMRGLLLPVCTRVYFPDQPTLAGDPVLALVPAARRGSLIAKREADASFSWDVHMQGALETVFFSY
jgi:protocatechuate 3,4-dioxygenase alpha subunit